MTRPASFTAFYDANVLYRAATRDLLMTLHMTGLFRPKWSRAVQEEWISSLLKKRPDLTREMLDRTRVLMDRHVRDALVTGYESLIDCLHLPDPDDRHVLAAAMLGRADVIVTMNLKHFPTATIRPLGLTAQHPDDFILYLIDLAPAAVVGAAQAHRRRLREPAKTVDQYLNTLKTGRIAQNRFPLAEIHALTRQTFFR